ncbi:hypothetical protein KR009_000810, partial [Drosophila setifemur]
FDKLFYLPKITVFSAGAGVYEDGMEMEEMRNLASAMQMSVTDFFPNMVDQELEQALLESEVEFLCAQPGAMMNSTMIVPPEAPRMMIPPDHVDRDCDTPPTAPIHMTVQALVHHPMDWSPTKETRRPNQKRNAGDENQPISDLGGKRARPVISDRGDRQQNQQEEAQYNPDATPVSQQDSGVSWQSVSLSSVSESSTIPSIGEMPSRHLISTSSVAVSDFSLSNDEINH